MQRRNASHRMPHSGALAGTALLAVLLCFSATASQATCPNVSSTDVKRNIAIVPGGSGCIRVCSAAINASCAQTYGNVSVTPVIYSGNTAKTAYVASMKLYGNVDYLGLANSTWVSGKAPFYTFSCSCTGESSRSQVMLSVIVPSSQSNSVDLAGAITAMNAIIDPLNTTASPVPTAKATNTSTARNATIVAAPFYLRAQATNATTQLLAAVASGSFSTSASLPCGSTVAVSTDLSGTGTWSQSGLYTCNQTTATANVCGCEAMVNTPMQCTICVSLPASCGVNQAYRCNTLTKALGSIVPNMTCDQDCAVPTRLRYGMARSLLQEPSTDLKVCIDSTNPGTTFNALTDQTQLASALRYGCGYTLVVTTSCGGSFTWLRPCPAS